MADLVNKLNVTPHIGQSRCGGGDGIFPASVCLLFNQ
jgi:hypothetical protein